MKSYLRYIAILCLWGICSISTIKAQEYKDDCSTPPAKEDHLARYDVDRISRSLNGMTIRIFVHIINETDGTGGPTEEEVMEELRAVQEVFEPFCLVLVGMKKINDSFFVDPDRWTSANRDGTGNLLNLTRGHSNAIDAFIVPDRSDLSGTAFEIPNRFFAMGKGGFGRHTFAHELGHCLGLFHTHETAFGAELVNGMNCSNGGDKVCDTPADPRLNSSLTNSNANVDINCNYTGTARDAMNIPYNPDPSLIMGYAQRCRTRFSPGQVSRMIATIVINMPQILVNDDNLSLHTAVISSGESLKVAKGSITAGNPTPPITDEYFVRWGAYVTHTAGDRITLIPGFRVTALDNDGFYMASIDRALCNQPTARIASKPYVPNIASSEYEHPQEAHRKSMEIESLSVNAYPNPFTQQLTVDLALPTQQEVSIVMLNTIGQIVKVVEKENVRYPGNHSLKVSAANLSSGVYYLKIQVGDEQIVKKLVKS